MCDVNRIDEMNIKTARIVILILGKFCVHVSGSSYECYCAIVVLLIAV